MKNILVFVPDKLKSTKNGALDGYFKQYSDCEAYYITDINVVKDSSETIGFCGVEDRIKVPNSKKCIYLNNTTARVSLINHSSNDNVIKIVYDYQAFRNCDLVETDNDYGQHFKLLIDILRKRREARENRGQSRIAHFWLYFVNILLLIFERLKFLNCYSTTISHFHTELNMFKWYFTALAKERKITPMVGNYLCSRLLDWIIGVALLHFCMENEGKIMEFIEDTREEIILNFKDLLVYLMGSPIGLKLNYALNRSLGTFFFYHISLWRIFLHTSHPFMKQFSIIFFVPGGFGVSYYVAIISDVISIATFHVYCIYVYAARLIYFQVIGLVSLSRLFIGRKYNPLRQKVDSYQYSPNQLFIGTLGFTVLLFLLPTTAMYYAVFITFRLIILIIMESLAQVRYKLHRLPIYLMILWVLKSPQVAGPIHLKWKKSKDHVVLEASLQILPLSESIEKFTLKSPKPKILKWEGVPHKILTGVFI